MIRWLWNKMMKWGWDFNRNLRETEVGRDSPIRVGMNGEPDVRIAVWTAMNGRVLELSKVGSSPHHNIEFKTMIVPEGEKLSDVVTLLLISEGLK